MRALEVVVLHEQRHAALTVLKIGKDRAREKLLPHRLPEPLDLAASLRMMRTALEVHDPLTVQLRLKLRRSTPSGVLPPLIGENLPRRSVLSNTTRERLEHQSAPLVMRHGETHQVARVIIQERRHVEPLVPAQQKREQVRLPQLVGLRPLEALLAPLRLGACRGPLSGHSLRAQNPSHRGLGSANAEKAPHHIANAPTARLRIGRFHRHDRRALAFARAIGLARRRSLAVLKGNSSARPVALHPAQRRRVRHAELGCDLTGAQPFLNHTPCHGQPHIQGPSSSGRSVLRVRLARTVRLDLACHVSCSFAVFTTAKQQDEC